MGDLKAVLEAIDARNAADPRVEVVDGVSHPKERLYGRRMSARLAAFEPNASEPLQIAARAQHVERWTVPRVDFAEGRAGYLKWRHHLYGVHADIACAIMEAHGYGPAETERVQTLLRKKGRAQDAEVQCLEDVICLVFLEFELRAFAAKHPDDKVVDILRKTWPKMSARGHEAALALDFGDLAPLIQTALAPDD
jgi:hypothetical protein